ncbi:hypothetical protein [Rubrivirga sp. IMCC43871]|uniref:hypothetical protein n=1 Tax=Rubrivirga sp. IMCC43871 TaxID=3391575 RepID=UPI0039900CB5
MRRRFFSLALLVVALAACDSTEEFVVGGTYSGVTEDLGTTQTIATLDIPETASGGSFRFSALIVERGPSDEVITGAEGTGTYDHPTISLTVEGEVATGTVSDDGETIRLEVDPGQFATLRRE